MKIGVVADTHSRKLPKQLLDDFEDVDLIFVMGDICSMDTFETLCKIKEAKGVYGNMDGPDIRNTFPRRQVVLCQKFSIGLFHGEGPPYALLNTVKKEFKNTHVDAVVFGHSHHPFNKVIDNVLYFNPGSPTDTVFAPYQSYGILEINDKIVGKIIKVRNQDG